MGGNLYLIRAEGRWRAASLLGLVLLVGLAGGLVFASAGGARRTDTAYDRFVEAANASHVLLSTSSGPGDYAPLRDIDGIEAVAPIAGLELFPDIETDLVDVVNLASVDGTYGWEVDRPNIVDGRLPTPSSRDEVLVNEHFAAAFDVRPGDRIDLRAEEAGKDLAGQAVFPVTVTGIGVFTTDVVPTTYLDAVPSTLVPPRLAEEVLATADVLGFDGGAVVLADPADTSPIDRAFEVLGADTFMLEQSATHTTVEQAIRPQAVAMWAFALVVAVATALLSSQAVSRHAAVVTAGTRAVEAVGVRRRERVLQSVALHSLTGVGAALLASAIAVAASPVFPIGSARAAEPHPGFEVNLAVLAIGGAAVVALMAGAAAVGTWISTRPVLSRDSSRRSVLAGALAAIGGSLRMVLGMRRAFETGTGGASVPVRSGLIGASLAVAAVIAAVTFATSLNDLVSKPARYGQTWDVAFDGQFGPVPARELLDRYRDDDRVEGLAGIEYVDLEVESEAVPAVAFQTLAGDLAPTIMEGRAPSGAGEIVLGGSTLGALGLSVGDRTMVDTPEGPEPSTVVGRAVFPQLSLGSFRAMGLGTGALVAASAMPPAWDAEMIQMGIDDGALPPGVHADDFIVEGRAYNAVLIAASAGAASSIAAELAQHPLAAREWSGYAAVRIDQRPAAISTYADVRTTPVLLAAALAGLAAGMVAHLLLAAVRRRRRELAICRVLGMLSSDLASVVRWQATAVALIAVLVGVPLGLAGGRITWRLFAADLGVPSAATLAWLWVGVAVAGTLLVANVAAAIPGWRARRLRPAHVLRAE